MITQLMEIPVVLWLSSKGYESWFESSGKGLFGMKFCFKLGDNRFDIELDYDEYLKGRDDGVPAEDLFNEQIVCGIQNLFADQLGIRKELPEAVKRFKP